MKNEQEHPPSHEEREVQTLVKRIEQMEVTREAAREAEAKDNARRLQEDSLVSDCVAHNP